MLEKWVKVKVAQSCPTLCNPMDYTVHEILQARILEWVAYPFSRGSSQPRDWSQVSRIAGRLFTSEPQGTSNVREETGKTANCKQGSVRQWIFLVVQFKSCKGRT